MAFNLEKFVKYGPLSGGLLGGILAGFSGEDKEEVLPDPVAELNARKQASSINIPGGSRHPVEFTDEGANDRVVAPEQPMCFPPFKSETHEGNGPSDSPKREYIE